jgi:hypothetical protein
MSGTDTAIAGLDGTEGFEYSLDFRRTAGYTRRILGLRLLLLDCWAFNLKRD